MGQKMSTCKSGADNFQPSVQVEDLHNVVESDSASRTSSAFSGELLQNDVADKTHKTSQTPLRMEGGREKTALSTILEAQRKSDKELFARRNNFDVNFDQEITTQENIIRASQMHMNLGSLSLTPHQNIYTTEAEIVAALRGRLPKPGEVPIYILIGAQVVTVGPSLHATRRLLIGQCMTLLPIIKPFPYYMEHIQCTI